MHRVKFCMFELCPLDYNVQGREVDRTAVLEWFKSVALNTGNGKVVVKFLFTSIYKFYVFCMFYRFL
jgi:hypothetical protein